jgi:hypothetical protein
MKSSEFIKEDAGCMGAGSVAAVVKPLGETPKELIKRQKAYTNQRTPGGIVKGIKKTESK